MCTSNYLNKNLISELKDFKIIYANKVASTSIKYPTFLRKLVLTKKIEKLKPNKTIIWDFVPRLARKPKNTDLIYYDHGCSWRHPMNVRTINFFKMIDNTIAVSNASKRVMELRFSLKKNPKNVQNRLPVHMSGSVKTIKDKSVITLGTASRLVGLKAIGISILALHELLKEGVAANLVIAGDGEQREQLEALALKLGIKDHIKFLGYQDDMTRFYSEIDIYLSTPATEPFGLSCIEALSQGVPVIFPLIDGQPEAVKNQFCGIGIIPDMSTSEYYKAAELDIDFPHEVYDPIKDCLTQPKLITPIKIVPEIKKIINDYEKLSKNALIWSKETMNYDLFIKEFESAILK